MSYDLPVKRCFNLEDHPEHSWEFKDEIHVCPGMPVSEPAARPQIDDISIICAEIATKRE